MKKTRRPKILTLAILTTLTILTWISFEVWRAFTKPQPIQTDAQILAPLDSTLDTSIIDKLKGYTFLPDSDARRGVVPTQEPQASPTPSPSPTSQPTASPTGAAQ